MGRKSQVRQQRRAAERNYGSSKSSHTPAEKHMPTKQDLILAAMAMKALHCPEPGAVLKTSLPGDLAAIEFKASADILLKEYHEQESSIDFKIHRVLIWERREKQGEAMMMILNLDQLAAMADMER